MTLLYLIFVILFGFTALVLLIIRRSGDQRKASGANLNQITLIIPFRNEEKNLPFLLSDLREQKELPGKMLFVDDHSTDRSADFVSDYVSVNDKCYLIRLPDSRTGKKQAIKFGLEKTESEFSLTLDADVRLNSDFFSRLEINPSDDLQIRPVIMTSKNFFGNFFATEYLFFNSLNYVFSPVFVMSASGANLLFRNSTFRETSTLITHEHISSGDDYFLLRSFQLRNAKVSVSNELSQAVATESVSSFAQYLNQRIRWLGKTKSVRSMPESVMGITVFLYLVGGVLSLTYLLIQGEYTAVVSLFVIRFVVDTTIFLGYTLRLKQGFKVVFLLLFQIIYPIIFLLVVIGALCYKPQWKGRKIS
ncbi:MAG: glycosyltransferase [Brumimicrobium sp.]|nr:glycosyltransferase [Brumimicrobium sp.]